MNKEEILNIINYLGGGLSAIKKLKKLAIDEAKYEMAASIREIEKETFPEEAIPDELEKDSMNLRQALRLFDMEVDQSTAFIIIQTAKVYLEKGDQFDIMDSSKIKADAEKYFK